ncbi:MAG TPA: hypothetical protein VKQ70_02995 [Caulobacteraceae bacterium]|nr:hypothetical protein [Caulobacteraceae bacterium]
MQRASAAFGLLIFILWLAVLAVGLAYVTVWAATQRRPQWRILSWLDDKQPAAEKKPQPEAGAEVIPFDRQAALEKRRKRA